MSKERLLLQVLLLLVFTGRRMAQDALPSLLKAVEPMSMEPRRLALETAGAFENDGFRIRDGEWSGTLSKEMPLFLQVTLFAGENYWFVAASPTTGALLHVTVYDASGKPVKSELWHNAANAVGTRSATGVAPTQSGKYFVGVEGMRGSTEGALDFSLVYCYK